MFEPQRPRPIRHTEGNCWMRLDSPSSNGSPSGNTMLRRPSRLSRMRSISRSVKYRYCSPLALCPGSAGGASRLSAISARVATFAGAAAFPSVTVRRVSGVLAIGHKMTKPIDSSVEKVLCLIPYRYELLWLSSFTLRIKQANGSGLPCTGRTRRRQCAAGGGRREGAPWERGRRVHFGGRVHCQSQGTSRILPSRSPLAAAATASLMCARS